MNKVKEFFKKLAAQIKNTAWIQQILIVIVIFVILFSLNPLTNAIKKGWTSLTSVNKMETISYQEYVEKVNNAQDGEKFVTVSVPNNGKHLGLFIRGGFSSKTNTYYIENESEYIMMSLSGDKSQYIYEFRSSKK